MYLFINSIRIFNSLAYMPIFVGNNGLVDIFN